jgi:hypothetical protein
VTGPNKIGHVQHSGRDWRKPQDHKNERKMLEKDLYPAVENFLKSKKNCLAEYVGTELSLKRGKTSLRADVFGISKSNQDEPIIYLWVKSLVKQ